MGLFYPIFLIKNTFLWIVPILAFGTHLRFELYLQVKLLRLHGSYRFDQLGIREVSELIFVIKTSFVTICLLLLNFLSP